MTEHITFAEVLKLILHEVWLYMEQHSDAAVLRELESTRSCSEVSETTTLGPSETPVQQDYRNASAGDMVLPPEYKPYRK